MATVDAIKFCKCFFSI